MKTLKKPKPGTRNAKRVNKRTQASLPTPKESVLELVRNQPDDASWSELMYRLYVRERIERGFEQIANAEFEDGEAVFAELLRDDDE